MSLLKESVEYVLGRLKFRIWMLASSYMSDEDAKKFSGDVFYHTWNAHLKGCWEVHGGCLFCDFEKIIDLTDFENK